MTYIKGLENTWTLIVDPFNLVNFREWTVDYVSRFYRCSLAHDKKISRAI